MIENVWLIFRKRVISPFVLIILCMLCLSCAWIVYCGMNIPWYYFLMIAVCLLLITLMLLKYRAECKKILKNVNPKVDYLKKYNDFVKEVDWYLAGEESTVRVYIYPDWIKYFHVYLMEMLEYHKYEEISDSTVLACMVKALITKYDRLYYIGCFCDAVESLIISPKVYAVKRDEKGRISFVKKEWKTYLSLDKLEKAFGIDCVAERIKVLLKNNASLIELEEFFEALYECGKFEE